jgi:imidazolonepropionase-like amidohydrolase
MSDCADAAGAGAGTLQPAKDADIVAVEDNPLASIDATERR